ncbi:hypothetical protein OG554_35100 [Streptomyces griseus]|uniref:hypothetical protein n=1 Tax=Streptomyces griseus TaxID=1911 RepID=UPI00386AF300|nr:hypothetical protein OG554_35100 [Streptomyces fimicarius]
MTDNGDGRPSAGELGELDELRRRLSALEKGGPSASHHRFRSFGSVLLILLAALLSMLSVVAVRADSIVGDTDRYVATVGPLAGDPDVQKAVTNRVTAAVLAEADVEALVKELTAAASQLGVPPRVAELLGELDGPIVNGLQRLVSGTVERVVTSSAFETDTRIRQRPGTPREAGGQGWVFRRRDSALASARQSFVWVNGNRRAHAAFGRGGVGGVSPGSGRAVRAPFQVLDRGRHTGCRGDRPLGLELPEPDGRGVDRGAHAGGLRDSRVLGGRLRPACRLPRWGRRTLSGARRSRRRSYGGRGASPGCLALARQDEAGEAPPLRPPALPFQADAMGRRPARTAATRA